MSEFATQDGESGQAEWEVRILQEAKGQGEPTFQKLGIYFEEIVETNARHAVR